MDRKELEVAIIRAGLTKNDVIKQSGISKKTFYSRLKGRTQFKQGEIANLKNVLGLSDSDIVHIFFA